VNAVNPTVVNIGMGPHVWSEQLKLADEHKARIPLGHFAGHISLLHSVYYYYILLQSTSAECSSSVWLGNVRVRCQTNDQEVEGSTQRSGRYQVVTTWMGDLSANRYLTNNQGQGQLS